MAEFDLSTLSSIGNQLEQPETQPTGVTPFSLQDIGSPQVAQGGQGEDFISDKQRRLAETSKAKQLLMGAGNGYDVLATAVIEGNDIGSSDLAQELAYGNAGDISIKYGDQVGAMAVGLQSSMRRNERSGAVGRSVGTTAQDSALGVGAGAVNAFGGMAAFGTGLVSDDAGAAVAGFVNNTANSIRDNQSVNLQQQRAAGAIRSGLDTADSNAQYEEDVASGDSYAGIKRFGREALTTAVDLYENPALAGDLVSEGAGSLVGSFGIGRIAAVGAAKVVLRGQGMTRAQVSVALKSEDGQALVNRLTRQGMPASIGVQEGGGAYAQIQAEIQAMTEQELAEGSPEYNQMRQNGDSHEQARNAIANAAGLEGGAIQGLIGAATGTLVSKFEANPLSLSSGTFTGRLREFGGNVLRETGEEGFQEGSAGVVTGAAIERNADEGRDIYEGLGTGVVQGAVAGAGLAGGIQAPGLALSGVGAAGSTVAGAARNRVENVRAGVEAESGVNTSSLRAAATDLSSLRQDLTVPTPEPTVSPESSTNVEEPAAVEPEVEATPEAETEADKTTRIGAILDFTRDEIYAAPDSVQDALLMDDETGERGVIPEGTITDRGQSIASLVEKLDVTGAGALGSVERAEVSLWLRQQAEKISAIGQENTSDQSTQLQNLIKKSTDFADVVLSNPTVKAVYEATATMTSADLGPMPEVTADNVNSPEVTNAIKTQTLLSQSNPTGIDVDFVSSVLSQRKIQFSDSMLKGLRAAADIAIEAKESFEKKEALYAKTEAANKRLNISTSAVSPTNMVSSQINTKGKDLEKGQLGLTGHHLKITDAIQKGDIPAAQQAFDNLGGFSQSMINKLTAARESYGMNRSSKNTINFDVWDGQDMISGAGSVFISPFKPNNVQLGQTIAMDTNSTIRAYNNLLEQYGDVLTGEKKTQEDKPEADFEVIEKPLRTQSNDDVQRKAVEEPTPETQSLDEEAPKNKEPESDPKAGKTAEPVTSEDAVTRAPVVQDDEVITPDPTPTEEELENEAVEEAELKAKADEEAAAKEADRLADEAKEKRFPTFSMLPTDSNDVNRFVRAFTVDTDASELMQGTFPITGLVTMLEDYDNNADELGLPFYMDADKAAGFAKFVRKYGVPLQAAMDARLNEQSGYEIKGKKVTPLEAMVASNGDFAGMTMGKAMTIVDLEKGEYESRLLGSAVLAALHWTMNHSNSQIPLKVEDIAKLEGINEGQVTAKLMNSYNLYTHENTAKQALARVIMDFWGAKPDSSVTTSDTDGIAQGVAAELLQLMEGNLIDTKIEKTGYGVDVNGVDYTKKVAVIRIKEDEILTREIKQIGELRSLIADGFVPQSERPVYIGTTPKQKENEKQKGNIIGGISSKNQRALEGLRSVTRTRNGPFLDFIKAIGMESYVAILGAEEYDSEITHVLHAESLDGRSKGLRRSYTQTLEHDSKVLSYAEVNAQNIEDVTTRYDYFVASNGRAMAMGLNGQADKTMRESFPPTPSTLDLTDPETQDKFWLAVAQMSGIVKTERNFRSESVDTVQNEIFDKYPDSIAALEEFLETGVVSDDSRNLMEAEIKNDGKLEAHGLHAIMAVAQYSQASAAFVGGDTGAFTEFKTFLGIEADGVADGPFHAQVHFLTKGFSESQLVNMRKGGLFLNEKDMTLNEHLNEQSGTVDQYQSAADLLKTYLTGLRKHLLGKTDKRALEQHNSMMRILTRFGDLEVGVDAQGNQALTIGRKVLKNPLTITIYGSGEDGIAGNIVGAVNEVIYAKISDLLKLRREMSDERLWFTDTLDFNSNDEKTQFNRDLTTLYTNRLTTTFEGEYYFTPKLPDLIQRMSPTGKPIWTKLRLSPSMTSKELKNFQFSYENIFHFTDTVKSGLVKPMVEAIDVVTDNARDATKPLLLATSVQSLVIKNAFKSAVDRRLAERRDAKEIGPREQLSRDDYKAIYLEVAPYAGVVESVSGSTEDSSHVNVTSSERGDEGFEVARSMDGKYRGETAMPGPSDAGVSIMPQVVISEGDARMMVEYFANPDSNLNVEQVFDGLNTAIADINEVGKDINAADAKAIMANPLKNAAESFASFLRMDPKQHIEFNSEGVVSKNDPEYRSYGLDDFARIYSEIGDGANAALFASLEAYKPKVKMSQHSFKTPEEAFTYMMGVLSRDLTRNGMGAEARKHVMDTMGYSLDHMATAEAPFNNDAEIIEAYNDEDLVTEMNVRYEAKLDELMDEAGIKADLPAVATPDPELEDKIKKFGVDSNGVTQMSMKAISKVLEGMSLGKDHKALLGAMQGSLADYRVVIGSSADATKWRNANYPLLEAAGLVELGQADIENKVIYISNVAPETVLHEMTHAVVGAQVVDYYTDPTLVSDTSRLAIGNLEKMMEQFMGMDFSNDTANVVQAAQTLRDDINRGQQAGTQSGKAAAMNEFIAWTLTNQNLVNTLSKTKNHSALKTLVNKALKGLKRLLGLPEGVSLDMLSNIQWNTAALMRMSRLDPAAQIRKGVSYSGILHQRSLDTRLKEITKNIEDKVAFHIRNTAPIDQTTERTDIEDVSMDTVNNLTANGLDLDQTQTSAFRAIQSVLISSMRLDSGSMVRAQKLFDHVTKGLKVEDLMESETDDWAPADREQAEDLFNLVIGKSGMIKDRHGRSTMLGTFLALSQVSPSFRRMLDRKDLPKRPEIITNTLDEALNSTSNRMIDYLGTKVAGGDSNLGTVKDGMDRLAEQLARIEKDDHTLIEKTSNSLFSAGDNKLKGLIVKASDKLDSFGRGETRLERKTLRGESENLIRKSMVALAAAMDEKKGAQWASAAVSLGNQQSMIPETLTKFMNEVVGTTDENRGVYNLMNKVKTAISALRQDHREIIPKFLGEQFSRKLEKDEWSALYKMLAKTDLASLSGKLSYSKIQEMLLGDKGVKAEIQKTKEELQKINRKLSNEWVKKSDELATHMVTGEVVRGNNNLLTNSEAISLLLDPTKKTKMTVKESTDAQPIIEHLVSLMALEKTQATDPVSGELTRALAETEGAGMKFMVNYLNQMRLAELAKATTAKARLNGYKGYIPSETRVGSDMIIADDGEYTKLITTGYTRVGDYKGSGYERGRKGYYFSTVGGNNTYNQGVMQTVQKTANGVDIQTGRTVRGTTGGMLERKEVLAILDRMSKGNIPKGEESLLPIYDGGGKVVGFERHVDPRQLENLKGDTQLDQMAGAWSGRQQEEKLAEKFNRLLIDEVKKVWDEFGKLEGKGEFINLADPDLKNELHTDAWSIIPPETKDYIKEVFGEDGFMVRKDMLDNTVGYRSLTLGEAWTGPSDLNETVKSTIKDVTTAVMGRNAYRNLVTAEKAIQAGILVAKNTIVVKSVIVPASNLASNVVQLLTMGVSPRDIVKGFAAKLVEIHQHLSNERRRVEINAELSQYGPNSIKRVKLESEKQSLRDSSMRMSIWPLINAGEFSTISEGITDADAALGDGKWADWMEAQMEKVPSKLETVGRYFWITRDTALFQGMSRAVQYGDFLAKAVMYDHRTLVKEEDHETTMKEVSDEFVNYNLLPGRVRSYAESMGATWFWAYKIKSIKVAHRRIRDNPLRALLSSIATEEMPNVAGVSIGSPISDNFVNVLAEGRLPNSIGLEMFFNSPGLNPWINMTN